MNTASLDLCRELYELSGWSDTHANWGRIDSDWGFEFSSLKDLQADPDMDEAIPAYDLGYLLRKLPTSSRITKIGNGRYVTNCSEARIVYQEFDTPEDAACKLAIELFKQGVLKS